MAYADFEFYRNTYYGNVVPEADFDRIADRASDFLDVITFDSIVGWLPDDERAKTKVQKAVCAVCDKLYQLELAEKNAQKIAEMQGDFVSSGGNKNSGIVSSRSAGSESISYETSANSAGGAKTWSAVYKAAGDEQATNKLLYDTAKAYLTGVRDNEGRPLLYAGL